MMNKSFVALLAVWAISVSAMAQGLRTSVCTVYPEFDAADSTLMCACANELSRVGFQADALSLRAYAEHTFGSGVLTDRYVLTNRHVVGYAKTAKLVFELREQTLTFPHCRIVSTGMDRDIAAIELPHDLSLLYALPLSEQEVQDGEDIYAAGFPGLGQSASWQLTRGAISNTLLRIGQELYIQHTAAIDPGSSGGPLLRKVDGRFEIIGLNTMKAFGRDRVGIAIPTSDLIQFISSEPNVSDQQVLDTYRHVKLERCFDHYRMLPDSMKQYLHDLEPRLPMDRLMALVDHMGGPDSLWVENDTYAGEEDEEELEDATLGLADPDCNFAFYGTYDYFLGSPKGHHITLMTFEFTGRWYVCGLSAGMAMVPYETTLLNYDGEESIYYRKGYGIVMGGHAGGQCPVRVARRNYLLPKLTAGVNVDLDFSVAETVVYFPIRAALDYQVKLNSRDLVLGVGYVFHPYLMKEDFHPTMHLGHSLQVKIGYVF